MESPKDNSPGQIGMSRGLLLSGWLVHYLSSPDGKRQSGEVFVDGLIAADIAGMQLCQTDNEGAGWRARGVRAPKVAREVGGGSGIRGRSGVRRAAARGQCNVRGRLKCKNG
jgi:hypothetical protein